MQVQLLESHARLSRELILLDVASPRIRHRSADMAHCTASPMTESARMPVQSLPQSRLSTANMHNTCTPMPTYCRPAMMQQVDKRQASVPQQPWQQAGQEHRLFSQPGQKATRLKGAGHAMSHTAALDHQRENSSCTPSTPAKTQARVAVDSPTLYLTPCDAALELLEDSDMQQENWYTPLAPYEACGPDQHQHKLYQQHAGLVPARCMSSVSASDDLLQTVDNFPEEWLASHDYS